MADEPRTSFATIGFFLTTILTIFSIILSSIAIYDHFDKPTSKVIAEVYVSPYSVPRGFTINTENTKDGTFKTLSTEERNAEAGVSLGIQRSKSIVTIVIKNTGSLPAKGLIAELDQDLAGFPIATLQEGEEQIHAWQYPRVMQLGVMRARQTFTIHALTPMPWYQLAPSTLLEKIRIAHDDGIVEVEPTSGPWAHQISKEWHERWSFPVLVVTIFSLCAAIWLTVYFERRLQLRFRTYLQLYGTNPPKEGLVNRPGFRGGCLV
ncbi:hypothetical protein [Xanthomonas albilineans]|uniref:hypothetical protein n=1 Tax=Xanthomonas albilineans TaxID=29447 RepID=UPI0005F32438|nr:hypothetical protein [Xanthomonas albilineans]